MSKFLSNQAIEAQAHFMVDLAKYILTEAGGCHSNTMFSMLNNSYVHNDLFGPRPHRNLQICSFLIGLYALGLNNRVSSNWKNRTYSTHVNWIQIQVSEIGNMLYELYVQI